MNAPIFAVFFSKISGTKFKKLIANKKAPLKANSNLSTLGFSVLKRKREEPLRITVINKKK
jgi:hypothetical protein